jgi:hypothetical protein
MNTGDILWRIIMGETIILFGLLGVLLMLLIWWLLRKLVAVPAITVATDKSLYLRSESLKISGTLTADGQPLADRIVGLSIKPPTGDAYGLPTATTDAEGNFSAPWVIPADAVAGSYVLTATSAGASATATFTLK